MQKITRYLGLTKDNRHPGVRVGVLSYWLALFSFLSAIYSSLSALGVIRDSLPTQGSAALLAISGWSFAALNLISACMLFGGRLKQIRFLAVFGVAIGPAYRLEIYLVNPIFNHLPVNVYFSYLWLFLLIFFAGLVSREITILNERDRRPVVVPV